MSDSEYESENEYESESEYESSSDDETENICYELKKSNYFKNCTSCRQVRTRQQILLGKCDALHDLPHMITDYYGCDKCCKLRNLFDDYIIPFTKLCKYPEHDEVHKIMQGDVLKDKYTLKVHLEMKSMYEHLDKFEFYKWHQEKKQYYNDTLCGYADYYQMVYHIFLKIIYHLKSYADDNISFEILYSEETTEFLNYMIVQNSN